MPEYKLHYFPIRGRAETARIIFAYTGVPYEDNRVAFDQWPAMKAKMPMGQMPMLEIGEKKICQSTAIARYLARENNLVGKDNIESAEADMLVDGLFDMWGAIKPVYIAKMKNPNAEKDEWDKFEPTAKTFLDRYAGFLANNNSGWFVGQQLTWADLAIAEFLSVLQDCFNPDVLSAHPTLKDFVNKVFALPKVKEYVESRPKTTF